MILPGVFQKTLMPIRERQPCGPIRKILAVMRLTLILLLAGLQVSARVHSQDKITLHEQGASLEAVLKAISKQTGYQYALQDQWKTAGRRIDIDVKNAPLDQVLSIVFHDQPFTYEIVKKIIVVKERFAGKNVSAEEMSGPGDQVEVRGTIMDENGRPLSGANVTIKETGRGTITNAKGEFVFPKVPSNGTLVFSFIGYAPEAMKVKDVGKDVKIFLKLAKNELDKVVIQAYGTTTQRLNTGNIATVTAAEIERQPVMNALAALEGKVPGLVVTQNNGFASSTFRIELRGRAVIDAGKPSEPLYIIDGVPLTVLNLNGANYNSGSSGFDQTNLSPAGGQSPFFSINPGDIESITILKDADATAIYGSRGANGVIIVTTKTGKAGKTKLDINAYQGTNFVTQRFNLLNTQQYVEMRKEAFANDGVKMTVSKAYDLLSWDTTRYTNWQDIYWGGIGHVTNADISLSGGDKQNTFRLGADYNTTTTMFTKSGAESRGSMQFNYTHKSLDQRLSLSLTPNYSYAQSDLKLISARILQAPDAPPIFDSKGNLNWSGWQPVPNNLSSWGGLLSPYHQNTEFFNSQLNVQYQIIKGLTLSTQLGYSFVHGQQNMRNPIISLNPYSAPKGTSRFGNTNITNIIVEPQLEYKSTLWNGARVSVMSGASLQKANQDFNYIQGDGYINDNLLGSIANAPIKSANDGNAQYRYAAMFARINFNWADKYIINLTGRRDGSSRFGSGKQYGNFGAVGVAWIFTEEHLLKGNLPFLSYGKLRASYGLTGNDQIGDYGYLSQWSAAFTIPYQGNPSYIPLVHPNPNLEWETNKKLEMALNLGFLNDRITTEIAWYRNRCGNQLLNIPLPILTGFANVLENSPGTVQNTGIEITARGKIITHRDFELSSSFDIGFNRNKLIAFPNLSQSPYASLFAVGKSLSIVRLLHYTGIDPLTGQYTYQDKNHDGMISTSYNNGSNDLYDKDLAVQFDGGFGVDIRYKDLQLNLFFNFRKWERVNPYFTSTPGFVNTNQSVEVLNRWQKPGDHARFARFTTRPQQSDQQFSSSDGVYADATFIRLRNAVVSYNIPGLKNIGVRRCSVYLKAQNLFALSRFNSIDPEVSSLGQLPPSKIFTGGIQFSF